MKESREVGSRVRKLRKEKKLTIHELAERVGISQSYLSNIERGVQQMPIDVLICVCEVFEITMSEFFAGELEHEMAAFLSTAHKLDPDERSAIKGLMDFMVLRKRTAERESRSQEKPS